MNFRRGAVQKAIVFFHQRLTLELTENIRFQGQTGRTNERG
jgi:hypothetical protein